MKSSNKEEARKAMLRSVKVVPDELACFAVTELVAPFVLTRLVVALTAGIPIGRATAVLV